MVMTDSISAQSSSRDVSSTISLYDISISDGATDSMSTRAAYESSLLDEDHVASPLSRPLSRSSVTSGLSMVATKDGIEGRKVARYGIPQYSLNLLNSMNNSGYWKKVHSDELTRENLSGPPITLREKMKLLNCDRSGRTTSVDSLGEQFRDSEYLGPSANVGPPKNHLPVPNPDTDLESNSSTLGDDVSYLRDIRSIPPLSATASEKDWAS